ncbi:Glycine--tRNA ligase alpha subunit [Frankliniella fusca]|uniref:Glycine--tRNA ligase alpha subunit n=1 Tax=Frankliniella fusca TaxID=407009 RepID=A0AAE1LPI1_9NEOP|nr:Glycine--tRNA ligase alpha subunit [Frankliniella fusca]
MEHEKNCESKIAFRLQEDTMKSGHFEKMQVGRAKAIFNNRTAAGLRIMADKYNKPELKTTAWFISLVVRWFELVSSRSHACALSLANREAYSKATEHIRLTSTLFQTMKIGTNPLKEIGSHVKRDSL